ncbi:hypothetical protein ACFX13_024496 [Malus domestica]
MCDAIHVKMTNDIGPDIPLTVNCESKDDDLGTQAIPFKGDYEFSFGTNIWGGTQFFGRFEWLAVFRYLDIYMQSRDSNECDDCLYRIVPTGACRLNPEYRAYKYNICFLWNSDVPIAFAPKLPSILISLLLCEMDNGT